MKTSVLLYILLASPIAILAQLNDSSVNNLVHSDGYTTSEYGAIPEYVKVGKGKQALILIPGWGFDASVFNDFMEANRRNYVMYAITVPGYGKTKAPPMPPGGTSYGEQSWNKGVQQGLLKLIEKEKIQRPVFVGHFTQGTQLAFRMAIDYPDKTAAVIILGGHAKFIAIIQGEIKEFQLAGMISYTDKVTAPTWFKEISREAFDDGNYAPEIYSLDTLKGNSLWNQSASVPLPVMIRYICEFFASDIKTEIGKVNCPVLLLRPMFTESVLQHPVNNYVRPQVIDCWNGLPAKYPFIQMKDIPDAATFIWKDKPREVTNEIKTFLNHHNLK